MEQIAEGESWNTLLAGYPELKKEDIKAALLYARASLDHTEVKAVGDPIVPSLYYYFCIISPITHSLPPITNNLQPTNLGHLTIFNLDIYIIVCYMLIIKVN